MKIKNGYILREVASNNIVVPVGETQFNLNGIMTLNAVGAFVWKLLENGATKDDLINAVLNEYDVDRATATADIERYLTKLRDNNIIED